MVQMWRMMLLLSKGWGAMMVLFAATYAATPNGWSEIMGIEDITAKAKEFLADSRVADALKSEPAEKVSDSVLDGVADAANKVTGGKFEGQIDDARAAADKAVGSE